MQGAMRYVPFAVICCVAFCIMHAIAADRLVIHEWGTFTSLQDEDGHAVAAINSDDELLPEFVHDLLPTASRKGKGFPDSFPSVTMRLETPVIYFHPAVGTALGPIEVSAEFHGGVLTQYYPIAQTTEPVDNASQFKPLTPATIGRITWSGLIIGGDKIGPTTDAHVWTAPRKVSAANVLATNGEAERYLFYRGVGNLNAPFKITRHDTQIQVQGDGGIGNIDHVIGNSPAWFYEIADDGRCAWRELQSLNVLDRMPQPIAPFTDADFAEENLGKLKSAMHTALVSDGLFDDEATAMLATWELSYFKSPGTRLFFLVPREWTDNNLPLHVSVDADIHRVMMGRIDLVTPEHRAILKQIAAGSENSADLYRQLGRFRDALLLDELKQRPTPVLSAFVTSKGLKPLPSEILAHP
jgi:hypothetical protein